MKAHSLRVTLADVLAAPSLHEPCRFSIPIPVDERRSIARGWLWLGIGALAASGAFSLLLVLARTPFVGAWLPFADAFQTALVVHVDLSVLGWFVAFAGVLWTVGGGSAAVPLGWAAFSLAATGLGAMIAAPFVARGAPVMANYVPVLDQPVFLYGVALLLLALALAALRSLAAGRATRHASDGAAALRFGLNVAAISALIAIGAFVWSWIEVPTDLNGKAYYEMLFWGGGHVLQFTWTLLLLVAWLWLATLVGARLPLSARTAMLFFAIGLAAVLVAPAIYLAWPVVSIEHNRMFTWLMRFGGGLAIVPLAVAVLIGLARGARTAVDTRALRSALLASIVLFGAGGLVGFLIQGSDVRVPAHYHGSIVGVTLAMMGLTYALMPRLGYGTPAGTLAILQPALYGAGQLLHILGLVWSGGYGVQRKVAGADQVLRSTQEVLGMALMGLGGLVAIAGGLTFVIVVMRAARRRARPSGAR